MYRSIVRSKRQAGSPKLVRVTLLHVQVAQLMEETSEAGRCWKLPPQMSSSEGYQW